MNEKEKNQLILASLDKRHRSNEQTHEINVTMSGKQVFFKKYNRFIFAIYGKQDEKQREQHKKNKSWSLRTELAMCA